MVSSCKNIGLWKKEGNCMVKLQERIVFKNTVNSEIFARTLFSLNFAYAKFRENKALAKWQNHSVVY